MSVLIYPITEDVAAAAADHANLNFPRPIIVEGFSFIVSTAVVGTTTAPVVSLDHTPSGGSRAEKVTLTIPDTTAAKIKVDAAAFAKFRVNPADSIHLEHKTAAVGGVIAGVGHYVIYYKVI